MLCSFRIVRLGFFSLSWWEHERARNLGIPIFLRLRRIPGGTPTNLSLLHARGACPECRADTRVLLSSTASPDERPEGAPWAPSRRCAPSPQGPTPFHPPHSQHRCPRPRLLSGSEAGSLFISGRTPAGGGGRVHTSLEAHGPGPRPLTRSFLSVQKSRVWCLFWTTMNVIPGW